MRPLMDVDDRVTMTLTDWKGLVGSPARVTLHDTRTPDGTVKIPGTIRDVTATGVTVELFFPLLTPKTGAPVILEMMARSALLQCSTVIQHSSNPQCIHLGLTEELHRIDRRQFQRVPVSVSARVALGEKSMPAMINNLSQGGCAAVVPDALAIGDLVTIDLKGTGLDPTHVQAQVTRCLLSASPHGRWEIGLAFANLSAEQTKHLAQYLKLYA